MSKYMQNDKIRVFGAFKIYLRYIKIHSRYPSGYIYDTSRIQDTLGYVSDNKKPKSDNAPGGGSAKG